METDTRLVRSYSAMRLTGDTFLVKGVRGEPQGARSVQVRLASGPDVKGLCRHAGDVNLLKGSTLRRKMEGIRSITGTSPRGCRAWYPDP